MLASSIDNQRRLSSKSLAFLETSRANQQCFRDCSITRHVVCRDNHILAWIATAEKNTMTGGIGKLILTSTRC